MNPTFEANFWGFFSGGALVLGAAVGYFSRVPGSVVAGVMAFGSGVLISALSFELNLPEGLSSSAGMRKAGRSAAYIFGVWTASAVACGLASLAGYAVFDAFSPFIVAATTAVAAGGMLAMIVDTMMPEAFAEVHHWARRFVVLGFLVSH